MSRIKQQLGVFAKHWTPGCVKKRLAATEGEVRAAKFCNLFLEATLRRFSTCGDCRILAFTPETKQSEFKTLVGPSWTLQPQVAGDLGQRMDYYFQDAFRNGMDQVLLIGSDSPHLPLSFVYQAYHALARAEVVLGPSRDGGYYLIGLRHPFPELFCEVDWGTSMVWQQTTEKINRRGCSFEQLSEWYDIDNREDLDSLLEDLNDPQRDDSDLAWLRDRIEEVDRSHQRSEGPH